MKLDNFEEVRLYIASSLLFVFIVIVAIVIWHSKPGDLDNDFQITITDLVTLGFMVEDGRYDWRGDFDRDGYITQTDVCILSAILAELKEGEYICE